MSKLNNLSDFLTDLANAIRAKKGTSGAISAQNFATEIANLDTGGGEMGKFYVVQTINGDKCSLAITNSGDASNAKMIGQYHNGKLYITEV